MERLIERLQNQTNRQIIEHALFQAPEEIEENPPSFSTTTTNNWEFAKLIRPLITLLK